MRVLAFETSRGECTVALRDGHKVFLSTSPRKMSQSEELVPRINRLLEIASLSYKDLDMVACSVGPGSFTGIRVGVATARGIKKAIPHINTIGISTMELIRANNEIAIDSNILIALQSYGTKFYSQRFSASGHASDITIMEQEDLFKSTEHKMIVPTETATKYINAYNVLKLATATRAYNSEIISPLYVHHPNIHVKKNIWLNTIM